MDKSCYGMPLDESWYSGCIEYPRCNTECPDDPYEGMGSHGYLDREFRWDAANSCWLAWDPADSDWYYCEPPDEEEIEDDERDVDDMEDDPNENIAVLLVGDWAPPGTTVTHKTFGLGEIVKCDGSAVVTIDFEEHGRKLIARPDEFLQAVTGK